MVSRLIEEMRYHVTEHLTRDEVVVCHTCNPAMIDRVGYESKLAPSFKDKLHYQCSLLVWEHYHKRTEKLGDRL